MGWTYNTADSVANDGPQITAVAIALTSASLSFLLLRLYVRVWMIKAIGAGTYDDLLAFLHTADEWLSTLRRLGFDIHLGESRIRVCHDMNTNNSHR
jgi:hypothetical protein